MANRSGGLSSGRAGAIEATGIRGRDAAGTAELGTTFTQTAIRTAITAPSPSGAPRACASGAALAPRRRRSGAPRVAVQSWPPAARPARSTGRPARARGHTGTTTSSGSMRRAPPSSTSSTSTPVRRPRPPREWGHPDALVPGPLEEHRAIRRLEPEAGLRPSRHELDDAAPVGQELRGPGALPMPVGVDDEDARAAGGHRPAEDVVGGADDRAVQAGQGIRDLQAVGPGERAGIGIGRGAASPRWQVRLGAGGDHDDVGLEVEQAVHVGEGIEPDLDAEPLHRRSRDRP